ncbi:MAG: zinc-ribbon domain-containing protein [Dehalococcoidia bacterium]|nr:zinc-ribbon domain-containing protein [Dehalococcoidia bacterium]
MSFQDKSIQCSACGITFTFTAGQQKFFASKGFTNEPRRCPQCRKSKRQQRRGPSGSWSSYADRAMLGSEYQQAYR